MKIRVFVLLLLFIQSCRVPTHEFSVEGKLRTKNGFEFVVAQENTVYEVQIAVPPEFRHIQFESKLMLYGPYSNSSGGLMVGARWEGNDLEVSKIIFLGTKIQVALDSKKSIYQIANTMGLDSLEDADALFDKPKNYASMARSQYPSVARVKMFKDRKFLGLFGRHSVCTATLIGKGLVLTNAHCIPNQDDCDYSSFLFSDYWEKDFFGDTIVREYACKKLHYVSYDYDFSLLEVEGNPSKYYPEQEIDLRPFHPQDDSWVYAIGYSPLKGNKRVEMCQLVEDASIVAMLLKNEFRFRTKRMRCDRAIVGGDSGSPVFNHNGKIIGVVWGSLLVTQENHSQPLDAFMTPTWLLGVELKRSLPKNIYDLIKRTPD